MRTVGLTLPGESLRRRCCRTGGSDHPSFGQHLRKSRVVASNARRDSTILAYRFRSSGGPVCILTQLSHSLVLYLFPVLTLPLKQHLRDNGKIVSFTTVFYPKHVSPSMVVYVSFELQLYLL